MHSLVFLLLLHVFSFCSSDLLGENAGGQGAALGFQYYGNGPIVTVLASKTSRK